MNKTCPECGEKILGRSDKKFCSDSCRNAHNNKLNSDSSNYVRNINNILRRNRRILDELNPAGTAKQPRSKMLEKGFDFKYFTDIYTTKKGATYYYCYEFGYIPIEGEYYFLVKKKEFTAE